MNKEKESSVKGLISECPKCGSTNLEAIKSWTKGEVSYRKMSKNGIVRTVGYVQRVTKYRCKKCGEEFTWSFSFH